jgi:hypothetical protein
VAAPPLDEAAPPDAPPPGAAATGSSAQPSGAPSAVHAQRKRDLERILEG